jgi:hypothetical protein
MTKAWIAVDVYAFESKLLELIAGSWKNIYVNALGVRILRLMD